MTIAEEKALRDCPEIEFILHIQSLGWRFLPVEPGREQLDGFYDWPRGWRDGIRIKSATDVLGIRTNPRNEMVWERPGTLADVVAELLALPAPETRFAPQLIRGSAPLR